MWNIKFYFIAPSVNPETKYLPININKIITGFFKLQTFSCLKFELKITVLITVVPASIVRKYFKINNYIFNLFFAKISTK